SSPTVNRAGSSTSSRSRSSSGSSRSWPSRSCAEWARSASGAAFANPGRRLPVEPFGFLQGERGGLPMSVSFQALPATQTGMVAHGGVAEMGLLLPAKRADALVELSRRRQQSVAQLLRSLIDRALIDEESAGRWS